MLNHLTTPLVKRAIEAGSETQLPWWSWLVFVVDLVIFVPVFLFVSYTVKQIYPVLTIVEDQNPPPAYQVLPIPAGSDNDASANKNPSDPMPNGKPVTSSLRQTHRLLKSHGGFKANFRGFFCLLAQGVATSFMYMVFSALFRGPLASLATLLATLSLVQLSTAWVHIVLTPESTLHFWQRLPPFKKTFKATAAAVTLYFLASEITAAVPYMLGRIFHVPIPDFSVPGHSMPEYDSTRQRILVVVFSLSSCLAYAVLILPAQVVLVRIQASLLPPDENTIVPFDRSFAGRVEPAVVGGKGYATIKDAWATFGCGAWKRLILLFVKIFFIDIAVVALMAAVLVPELTLMKMVAGGN